MRKKNLRQECPSGSLYARICQAVIAVFLIVAINISAADVKAAQAGLREASGTTEPTSPTSIGRMRLAIWPEYDDPGVLFIFDGRFSEETPLPAKPVFNIPKDAVISDVCSLSPKGQHFCQLYKTSVSGEVQAVTLTLPYANFYLSFHTPPLSPTVGPSAERKHFEYRFQSNYTIGELEVDIQAPLRAEGFALSSEGGETATITEKDGFTHYGFTFAGIAPNDEKAFSIDYTKKDPKPSVDIKYSPATMTMGAKGMEMDHGKAGSWTPKSTTYDRQRVVKWVIYSIFGTALIAAALMLTWLIVRRKKD